MKSLFTVLALVFSLTSALAAEPTLPVTPCVSGCTTIFTLPAFGQGNMANSLPFAIASDQSAIPASQSGTWNIGSITTLPALATGANTIGAVTQASGPWTSNVTQYGGTNLSTGTGASGAGIPRVTISNDSSLAANQSVNISQIAGVALSLDPCSTVAHAYTPINISTVANTKIITGTSAKKTYVCHLYLFAASTDNVGVVEGTGTNCATGTAGVIGGATSAAGINLAANQGWVEGNGSNAIAATATNADDFCLITSAAVQLSGVAVTVQQ